MPARRRPLTVILVCVLAVAALVIAGTTGWLIGSSSSGPATVTESSVDAGFARDMSTHHTQAIEMANYARDYTSDPSIKILARDIETQQYFQLGEMQGWLDVWNLSRSSSEPVMGWMNGHEQLTSDGLMPGMATPAEVNKLETLTGKALDIYVPATDAAPSPGRPADGAIRRRTCHPALRPAPRVEDGRGAKPGDHSNGAAPARAWRVSTPGSSHQPLTKHLSRSPRVHQSPPPTPRRPGSRRGGC